MSFLAGMLAGMILGVVVMCLLQINRERYRHEQNGVK